MVIDNCTILHAAALPQSGTLASNRGTNGQVDDGTGDRGQVVVDACSVDDLATIGSALPTFCSSMWKALSARCCGARRRRWLDGRIASSRCT